MNICVGGVTAPLSNYLKFGVVKIDNNLVSNVSYNIYPMKKT